VIATIRKTFFQGVLLILPLAITYVVLGWLFGLVTGISTPGARGLLLLLRTPESAMRYLTPLIAAAITIGVVMLVGLVGGNYLGKRIWASLEALLMRLPLVRWFYGSARQLMDAFRYSGGGAFREVVLVEYPRHGIWCLGFVTAAATGIVPGREDESVFVFLPTTPNPTSGYTIVVPRSDARTLDMSIEDGLKVIFSGGFISPLEASRSDFPADPSS